MSTSLVEGMLLASASLSRAGSIEMEAGGAQFHSHLWDRDRVCEILALIMASWHCGREILISNDLKLALKAFGNFTKETLFETVAIIIFKIIILILVHNVIAL